MKKDPYICCITILEDSQLINIIILIKTNFVEWSETVKETTFDTMERSTPKLECHLNRHFEWAHFEVLKKFLGKQKHTN